MNPTPTASPARRAGAGLKCGPSPKSALEAFFWTVLRAGRDRAATIRVEPTGPASFRLLVGGASQSQIELVAGDILPHVPPHIFVEIAHDAAPQGSG